MNPLLNLDDRFDASHRARHEVDMARRFAPRFWQDLSRIDVTRSAIFEVDARSDADVLARQEDPIPHEGPVPTLLQFAKRGGPDMSSLCSRPTCYGTEYTRRWTRPVDSTLARFTDVINWSFERHLLDHNIHTTDSPSDVFPSNFLELQEALASPNIDPDTPLPRWTGLSDAALTVVQRRLQVQRVTDDHHNDFWQGSYPILISWDELDKDKEFVTFRGVTPLTKPYIIGPKPDYFDGVEPEKLHVLLRNNASLRGMINTDGNDSRYVLPNFFIEEGYQTQNIIYAGAFGARAMHTLAQVSPRLRNIAHRHPQPYAHKYFSSADTFSVHLDRQFIIIYVHFLGTPLPGMTEPEYHHALLGRWDIGDLGNLRTALLAVHNVRTIARIFRSNLLRQANEAAEQYAGYLQDDIVS